MNKESKEKHLIVIVGGGELDWQSLNPKHGCLQFTVLIPRKNSESN